MDDLFDDALKEAYSYASTTDVILETLEVRHPAIIDENLQNVPIRIVRNSQDIIAMLEDDAPVNPSTLVTFKGFWFDIQLPAIEPGIASELIVTVDDVASPFAAGRRFSNHISDATRAGGAIALTHRTFLSSDLGGGPKMRAMHFEADAFDASGGRITARASFAPNTEQRVFPFVQYNPDAFPLLNAIYSLR